MTKQVQRRRGTDTQHTSFTGAEGEISVNTTNKSIHVHDGSTAGGIEAARADLGNVSDADLNSALTGNTLSSLTITSADINGGTIDGTVIGGSTPAAISGTTGTFSGDFTVDTNTLFVDASTNQVGIGTSSPAEPLHVIGTVRSDVSSTGDFNFTAVSTGGGQYRIYPDDATTANPTWLHQSNSSEDQAWVIGGVERMRITSSGNVGIGTSTSSPDSRLDVRGTVDSSTSEVIATFGRPDEAVRATIENGVSSGNGVTFGTTTSHDLALQTGDTERMTIGSNGDISFYEDTGSTPKFFWDASAERLGIGTSSPSAPLEVIEGNTDAVSIKTDGDIQLYDRSIDNRAYTFLSRDDGNSMVGGNIRLDASVTTGSHIGYSNGTDVRGGSGILFENTNAGAAAYGETIFVQSNDTNDDTWVVRETMRIDLSGRVGIGTSSPSSTLDVNGSLSKNSGSFKIDHPVKPDTHHLVHSFIEGPQADNLYRGKVTLVDGSATVNLDEAGRMTEGTFVALNGNVQCFTTNEAGWTQVRGRIEGNTLTIEAQDLTCTDEVSWLVIGERHDQHMIDTEWTDENGRVITEPKKTTQTEGAE